MQILFNKELGKYQLILPEEMIKDLDLSNNDGKAFEIFHENKLSLEWLYKDIEQRHIAFKEALQKSAKKRERKMIILSIILFLAVLAVLFNSKIAAITNSPVSIINLLCAFVIIFSGFAMFQTYALKGLLPRGNFIENLKWIEMQELIIERFGK